MNLFSYRLLTFITMPLIAYSGWKRCRKHKKQQQHNPELPDIPDCFRSRFGVNRQKYQTGGIWIHAVSVGETRSVFPLLTALKENYPNLPLTVTNGSTQGALQALQFSPVEIQHQMLPYDYSFAVKRFLKQIKPKLVIMVETEIWPNLYQACQEHNIPIILINARLKESSFKAYQKWGGKVITNALNQTQFIGVQFSADAEHFKALGAQQSKIKTLGNLKFDLTLDKHSTENANHWKAEHNLTTRPIWVAASTHAHPNSNELSQSEEHIVIEAHKRLLKSEPNALLILVPRHADRFEEVAKLLDDNQLHWASRSKQQPITTSTQVYLADTVGELMLWFAVSDVAFIGGSLVPFGGHNILEPAALNKPIISGEHFANLKALFEPFIDADAIRIVKDSNALADSLYQIIQNPQQAQELATKAHNCFTQQTGALQRTIEYIKPLLK
ncbi:lipid IV(A) 3-deoxy-D-manno-octulosonic acid transferase [Thiomicrorhabdus sp. Kp2]|uniref:lipid IV(A) 3-deoxy-D-manno-octulosonic acid transferase n=1 Tax=Thiomicrorhabdus sp. Kp2 TaxID=1123518 RepID=UPI0005949510|nr:lipid IV(A) 3-deoxy-D-manno-octulosonic acid transferase [Thiomicrorhabdus sp. Kp2]